MLLLPPLPKSVAHPNICEVPARFPQAVPALLALRNAVQRNCPSTQDTSLCAIFKTWDASIAPCRGSTCSACTLQHSSCGRFDAVARQYTCNWRYVECERGSVTRVLLGALTLDGIAGLGRAAASELLALIAMGTVQMCPCAQLLLPNHPAAHLIPLPLIASAPTDFKEIGVASASMAALPPELGQLATLEVLVLRPSAVMGGTLPTAWSQLANLVEMRISAGSATGTLPAIWGSLARLQVLDISSAPNITGAAQRLACRHRALGARARIVLPVLAMPASTCIGCELICSIHSTHMAPLVRTNLVAGTLPSAWSSLGEGLLELHLRGGGMRGALPTSWANLTALQALSLSRIPLVSGRLPAAWYQVMPLQHLELGGTGMSVTWSDLFTMLPADTLASLTLFNLSSSTGLRGSAIDPGLLATFTNLRDISLSGLGLVAGAGDATCLPSVWQQLPLSHLRRLVLASNSFAGPLPPWLASVVGPGGVIDLSGNVISGGWEGDGWQGAGGRASDPLTQREGGHSQPCQHAPTAQPRSLRRVSSWYHGGCRWPAWRMGRAASWRQPCPHRALPVHQPVIQPLGGPRARQLAWRGQLHFQPRPFRQCTEQDSAPQLADHQSGRRAAARPVRAATIHQARVRTVVCVRGRGAAAAPRLLLQRFDGPG